MLTGKRPLHFNHEGDRLSGSTILDVVLFLVLLGYVIYGFRMGLVRSLSAIVGIVAGALVAILVIPLVSSWITIPQVRVVASIVLVFVLLAAGHYLGMVVGGLLGRGVRATGLRIVDRVLGAVLSGVVAAVVVSILATSIGALGVPFLSPLIASSGVLRTIDSFTPDPAKAVIAQLRSVVTQQGVPRIVEALGGPTSAPELPNTSTASAALNRAAKSVVRIVGNAYACGQSQSGSGFVVSTDRVVTNAHVVAGVTEPVVEVPGEGSRTGRVVYFDPEGDLAVIAVNNLPATPLKLTGTLEEGDTGVTDGYPLGGPFSSGPARVISVTSPQVDNIYDTGTATREIYTLAADVQEGDSGGPLLTRSGAVAGVVFAKSENTANIGYAITPEGLEPVADDAATMKNSVSSGACIKG